MHLQPKKIVRLGSLEIPSRKALRNRLQGSNQKLEMARYGNEGTSPKPVSKLIN